MSECDYDLDDDAAILLAQLEKYVLKPLFSPGFALAARNAAAALNELGALLIPATSPKRFCGSAAPGVGTDATQGHASSSADSESTNGATLGRSRW